MATNDLRPLNLGELLDRTFSLYRRYFVLLVGIMAVPAAVSAAIGLAVNLLQSVVPGLGSGGAFSFEDLGDAATAAYAGVIILFGVILMIGGFGIWILYILAQGATTLAVSRVYLGRTLTVRGAYAGLKGQVLGLILVTILVGLIIFGCLLAIAMVTGLAGVALFKVFDTAGSPLLGGLVTAILVGIAVIVFIGIILRFILVIPALLVENAGVVDSIRRSYRLMPGHRIRAFVVLLIVTILSYAVIMLLQGPFYVALFMMSQTGEAPLWLQACTTVAGNVGFALTGPLSLIAIALLYFDIRVRKEAFDLQLLMTALEPGTSLPPAPPPVPEGPGSLTP